MNKPGSHRNFLSLVSAAGLLTVLLALSGCNTIEGIGEDVEGAGERIEDAASS